MKVRLNLAVELSVAEKLKAYATETGQSQTAVIEQMVRDLPSVKGLAAARAQRTDPDLGMRIDPDDHDRPRRFSKRDTGVSTFSGPLLKPKDQKRKEIK